MKVVLTCDDLIQRDHVVEVFEALLEIFDDAQIYTLVHKEGSIIGPVEMRSIRSSGMTHKVDNRDDFGKWSFLIPTATSALQIPCSVDLIVNLSHGLSHGIKKCKKTKQITYLYDFYLESRPGKTLREKFFKSYIKSWSRSKLDQVDELIVSSESLRQELKDLRGDIEVMPPFFKVSDFPLIPSSTFKYDYLVINATGLDANTAKETMEKLKGRGQRFCFVGADAHLDELKEGENDGRFFGERCSGELAPLLAGSLALVDFNQRSFPKTPLASLATGRPVIVPKKRHQADYLEGEGVFEFSSLDDLLGVSDKIKSTTFDSKRVRAHAMQFHDVKFKAAIRRKVEKLEI